MHNNQLFITPWNWFGSRITHRPEAKLSPPAQFLCDMNQEIEQVFDQFVRGWEEMGRLMAGGYLPHISMEETDKSFRLRFEAKGFEQGDLRVELKDGMLSISGKHEAQNGQEEQGSQDGKLRSNSFQQLLPLPQNIREEGIAASYQDGILTIDIPKVLELNRNRQIDISGGRKNEANEAPNANQQKSANKNNPRNNNTRNDKHSVA